MGKSIRFSINGETKYYPLYENFPDDLLSRFYKWIEKKREDPSFILLDEGDDVRFAMKRIIEGKRCQTCGSLNSKDIKECWNCDSEF